MRKICYISGTRADYGLMRSTLSLIQDAPDLDLSVIAAGMHLDPRYGQTVSELEADDRRVIARIKVPFENNDGAEMASNLGLMLIGMTKAIEIERPDLILLLGDRGEMLAGAIAGLHLSIPTVHIHGGERSGTVDEPVRHAISKLSHLHLTATRAARDRLIRMGEAPQSVHVVGAPGLDALYARPPAARAEVAAARGLDPGRKIALMIYHPVVQQAERAAREACDILRALVLEGIQVVAFEPNSDAGSKAVREVLRREADTAPGVTLYTHFVRDEFLDLMSTVDLMIGNSSAGIIEAASYGLPVVNVGSRQNLRERNANVIDVKCATGALRDAVVRALADGRETNTNIYGDGRAGERIVKILREVSLAPKMLEKVNAY